MKLAIRVQPGARKVGVVGRLASGEWKLAVSAPPEDGRANDAVTRLVAETLGVRVAQVTIARGHSARAKVIEVAGVEPAEVERRLAAACPGATSDDGE